VLAYMIFPGQHRIKLHSTNPLERLNKEVKRRADVIGHLPQRGQHSPIGAVLLEQNDEWLLHHRYMQIEGMAELTPPMIDADPAKLPPMAA
jgi:putative transposase